MARARSGYVAALVAGAAIVGAATFGVSAATSHHQDVAAAALAQTQASLEAAAESAASAAAGTDETSSDQTSTAQTSPATPGASSVDPTSPASSAVPTSSPTTTRRTTGAAPSSVTTPTVTTAKPSSAAPAATTQAANKFKDGQYSATTSYDSPGGQEQLGVTLTLKSDKVVKSDLQLLGGAGISHSYQSLFASGYLTQVLGKNIDTISLGAVSGSSLTGIGFNEAVKNIEEQARA